MTSILGHDIDGNPLRAGDRVVVVRAEFNPANVGLVCRIMGNFELPPGWLEVDIPHPSPLFEWHSAAGDQLRKLPPKTDHEPADEEFTEWLKGMNVGQPA